MFKLTFLIFFMVSFSSLLFAAGNFSTYPNQPKVKPVPSHSEIRPERDIPEDFDKISWKITGTRDGITYAQGSVPIYSFNDDGLPITVGSIPIGSEVEIFGFRVLSRKIFYALKAQGSQGGSVKSGNQTYKVSNSSVLATNEVNNIRWIAGFYLEASGFKPDGQ